jgi:hypothetical protein
MQRVSVDGDVQPHLGRAGERFDVDRVRMVEQFVEFLGGDLTVAFHR